MSLPCLLTLLPVHHARILIANLINSAGSILIILDDTLLHCQNSATLESAHGLLQTLTSNSKFATVMMDSGPGGGGSNGALATSMLHDILEDMGFGGLWRFCSLNPTQEPDKQCFAQTEKLIDVSLLRICSIPARPSSLGVLAAEKKGRMLDN